MRGHRPRLQFLLLLPPDLRRTVVLILRGRAEPVTRSGSAIDCRWKAGRYRDVDRLVQRELQFRLGWNANLFPFHDCSRTDSAAASRTGSNDCALTAACDCTDGCTKRCAECSIPDGLFGLIR